MSNILDIIGVTNIDKLLNILLKKYIEPIDEIGSSTAIYDKFDKIFIRALNDNNLGLVNILLDMDLPKNINACDNINNGNTALIVAAYRSNNEIAKLLIKKGADVNYSNKYMKTALIYATITGNKPLVKLLIDNGADSKLIDTNNKCAYDYTRDREILTMFGIEPIEQRKPLAAVFCVQIGQPIPPTKIVKIIESTCIGHVYYLKDENKWLYCNACMVKNNILRVPVDKNIKMQYHADNSQETPVLFRLDASTRVLNENNEVELLGDIYDC